MKFKKKSLNRVISYVTNNWIRSFEIDRITNFLANISHNTAYMLLRYFHTCQVMSGTYNEKFLVMCSLQMQKSEPLSLFFEIKKTYTVTYSKHWIEMGYID